MTTTEARTAPPGDPEAQRSAAHVSRLIAQLDELAPAFGEEVVGNEQAGLLSERTLELLRTAEIPSLLIPEALGGLGMFPGDALAVLDRLCQIDASIGWIGANWSSTGLTLAYFEPEVVRELLAGGQPLMGASGAPTGLAVPIEGGYRFSGSWQYGSGDLQADYVLCAGLQAGPDGKPLAGPGGMPKIRVHLVSGKDVQPRGNWDTLGLRATGSVDFRVEDVVVPERHVVDVLGAPPRYAGRQQSGGFLPVLSLLHSSFALGATRRLLDELIAFAHRPSSRGTVLADDSVFRSAVARQEMAVRSARALVFETWRDVDAQLKAGRPLTRRTLTLLRASMVHIHEVAREVATFVFTKAGGTSLRSGPLQRWVRDTLSGCQHFIVADSIYTDIGWELMGAPDNLVWSPNGLMPVG